MNWGSSQDSLKYAAVNAAEVSVPNTLSIYSIKTGKYGGVSVKDLLDMKNTYRPNLAREHDLLSKYAEMAVERDRRLVLEEEENQERFKAEATQREVDEKAVKRVAEAQIRQNEVDEHDKLVAAMVSQTGQSRDVCYFYLESSNWQMKEACELLQSMSS